MSSIDYVAAAFDVTSPGHFTPTANNPWNLPDWRDSTAYPRADQCSAWEMRWEFIRRHPDYRSAFEDYLANRSEWDTCGDSGSAFDSKTARAQFRFGVPRLAHPARTGDDRALDLMVKNSGPRYIFDEYPLDFVHEAFAEQRMMVSIDLHEPIPPQLERIQDWARECRFRLGLTTKATRGGQNNYALYWRLLDALESHASYRTIANTLAKEKELGRTNPKIWAHASYLEGKEFNKGNIVSDCKLARETLNKQTFRFPKKL